MIQVKVTARMTGLERARSALDQLNASGGGPLRPVMNQWIKRTEAFTRRRFAKLSKGGGGEWAPLAPSTIAGRRKGKGSGSPNILRDTGTLFGALTVGLPGNVSKNIPKGVEDGVGGGPSHGGVLRASKLDRFRKGKVYAKASIGDITSRKKAARALAKVRGSTRAGGLTVGQLAVIHHFGLGKVPARRIVVTPDAETRGSMANDLLRGVKRLASGGTA